MDNPNFTGTGVALVTPFTETLAIDYDALARVLTHVSQGGVDYLVVMGTTGESITVSWDEKKHVLAFVKRHNPRHLPIVYGLGGNCTSEIITQLHETDFTGVHAILSVSPYYNKPSQRGIYEHYVALANASPVPVILYNVPGRTASNITAATTLRLAQHPNIIGVKEASGNLVQCMEIAAAKPADFLLISGDDLLTLPMISFGAVGAISVLANAFPQPFTRMVNDALAGNKTSAIQHLFSLLPMNPLMYEEGNPVGLKQAMALLGICQNVVRLPMTAASEALTARIQAAMEEMKKRTHSLVA